VQKSRKNARLNFTIGTNEFCDYNTCQNPKTRLKDIVGDYQQIATAQMIAPYIDIEHNRSESFRQFVSGIRKFITAKR